MALSYIGKLQIDEGSLIPVGTTLYGTCSSLATDETKEVTIDNSVSIDTLPKGLTITVRFTNSNTASNAKLKVPGQNAFPIYKDSSAVGTTAGTSWESGSVVSFTYDSNRWYITGYKEVKGIDTNSATSAGIVTAGQNYPNRVWETNESGSPAWRDPNKLYLPDGDALLTALRNMQWDDVISNS